MRKKTLEERDLEVVSVKTCARLYTLLDRLVPHWDYVGIIKRLGDTVHCVGPVRRECRGLLTLGQAREYVLPLFDLRDAQRADEIADAIAREAAQVIRQECPEGWRFIAQIFPPRRPQGWVLQLVYGFHA